MSKTHFLVLLILTCVVCAPLFVPGFYTSHDGQSHLVRIYHFYYLLLQGHLIPRWDSFLNSNLGYPLFDFTYPLPYYFTSAFLLLGFGVVNSLKAIFFLSTFVGAFFYYLWVQRVTKSSLAGLGSSALFLFTPYRFLDLYVRADLGEIVILSLVPIAFYAVSQKNNFLLAIGLSLLPLSHPPLAVVFVPIILLYALMTTHQPKKLVIVTLFGLSLSAYFWLPALGLLKYIRFTSVNYSSQSHLLNLRQLLYSPWNFGFSPTGMSFQLGIGNWIVLCLATLVLFKSTTLNRLILFTCWLSLFLVTKYASLVWANRWVQFIQFPWRLLSVPLIFIPILLGHVTIYLKRFAKLASVIFFILILYANRNHIRTNQPQFVSAPDSYFFQTNTTTTTTPDELMPKVYTPQTINLFSNSPIIMISQFISLGSLTLLIFLLVRKIKPWPNHSRSV